MKKKRNRHNRNRIVMPIFLLKMKLLTFFIFVSVASVTANSYAQQTKFNMNFKNATVGQVFREIEENSQFILLYSEKSVDVNRKVNVEVENQTVDKILDQVFSGTKNYYEIHDRQIAIMERVPEAAPATTQDVSGTAQQNSISGIVTDSSGTPLPGVTVVVKGTTLGTITNAEGKYTLNAVPGDAILVFSFVGMKTQEVPVAGKATLNITMVEGAIGLQEVVAIGYGTQKKVNLTGAVSVISSESLENRPITTTAEGLQGVIPNLNINFSSGDPTTNNASYNIRGIESINGGSPYILVDGVPMNIEDINPNDIANITVLKDASASAIYGGKAAFGVILVTTKQGKGQDKIRIKYSNETALSTPIINGYTPVNNSLDYVTYKNLMQTNNGNSPSFDDDYLAAVQAYNQDPANAPDYGVVNNNFRYYGYNNYKDLVLRNLSPSYKHNLSFSGGTEKSNYYVSFGNFRKEGLLKVGNDVYSRNNILVKLQQNVADWISLDQELAVNMIKTNKPHDYGAHELQPSGIMLTSPLEPLKFPENDPIYPELGGLYFDNIIGYLDKGGRNIQRAYETWLTTGVDLKPLKNLKIRSEFSYNYRFSGKDDVLSTIEFAKSSGLTPGANNTWESLTSQSSVSTSSSYGRAYIFNTYAEYELKNIGNHYFKAMVGYNQEEGVNSIVGATGYNMITPYVQSVNATIGQHVGGTSATNYGLMGTFYRLNYNYHEKYLVELSGRYDGTSRFPQKDHFGFFPSGSVGWRLSEEGFMKGLKMIDYLKLRASYGALGNQLISWQGVDELYPYIASLGIATSNYLVLDNSGTYPLYTTMPDLVSSTLTWETVASTNFGIDYTLFKQKLDGSFDYYVRSTKNMLMRRKYPEIIGGTPPFENGADLRTNGWEFTVSWRDKIHQDLSYNLRFSIWDFKSTITKYDNPTGSLSTYYNGQVIGDIWGYQTYGLFQSQEEIDNAPSQTAIDKKWYPGDVRYVDQPTVDTNGDGIPDAGDGKITPGNNTLDNHGDLKIIGNNLPRYSYSFNLDLDYKNWSLSAFFQGIGKRDYYPNPNFSAWWPWAVNGVIKESDITDSWTETNTDAYWYRATSDATKNTVPQTRWLQDGSYFRLKSLIVSYSIPEGLIKKVGLSNARLFVSGQNLWEHSNFIYGRDADQNTGNNLIPNQQFYGPLVISYPSQRTFSVGVNLTF